MKFELMPVKDNVENLLCLAKEHPNFFSDYFKFDTKLGLSKELINNIKRGKIKNAKRELLRLSKEYYNKKKKEDVDKRLKFIKETWLKNEKKVLDLIKEITGIKINTKNITCYIDPFTSLGFYGKNNINVTNNLDGRGWILLFISHELFHIFYWKKVKKMNLKCKNKEKEWALSEVTAYLLERHSKLKNLWKNVKDPLDPQFKSIYRIVKNIWKNNSFDDHLIKSYKKLKSL